MILREELEKRESETLKKYACFAAKSMGRRYRQDPDALRTCFSRDRGRIIHAAAFRRLEYKTQVFANHVGDHYRTRLTHSLEVAQIARTIAQTLGLNVDLAESIALCHDLGHPPYGHAGENCLQELMKDNGGFEHNLQSLRIVDILDHSYQEFPGLNLSYELRACLWLHSHERKDGAYKKEFDSLTMPPLEGQLVDIADSLAYTAHDLEDGLRSGILRVEDLGGLELWNDISHAPSSDYSGVKRQYRQRIGFLINMLIEDLLEHSWGLLQQAQPENWAEVSSSKKFLIAFSPKMEAKKNKLNAFLYQHFYSHPKVNSISKISQNILGSLFMYYHDTPSAMPAFYRNLIETNSLHRVCCDYVAGMTDRYAHERYQELF